mgnify:CR=1 FL=1
MGRFVNSGNSAFQVALNSEIYVDKTGLLAYTNKVMDTTAKFIMQQSPPSGSGNPSLPICSPHITVKAVVPKKCSHLWKSVRHLVSRNI